MFVTCPLPIENIMLDWWGYYKGVHTSFFVQTVSDKRKKFTNIYVSVSKLFSFVDGAMANKPECLSHANWKYYARHSNGKHNSLIVQSITDKR